MYVPPAAISPRVCRQRTRGARTILGDDLLAPTLAELLPDEARRDVMLPRGEQAHDEAYRPRRIGLSQRPPNRPVLTCRSGLSSELVEVVVLSLSKWPAQRLVAQIKSGTIKVARKNRRHAAIMNENQTAVYSAVIPAALTTLPHLLMPRLKPASVCRQREHRGKVVRRGDHG